MGSCPENEDSSLTSSLILAAKLTLSTHNTCKIYNPVNNKPALKEFTKELVLTKTLKKSYACSK